MSQRPDFNDDNRFTWLDWFLTILMVVLGCIGWLLLGALLD